MKLCAAPYELVFRRPIPARWDRVRCGALLRLEEPSLGIGFADCHPWAERGDEPLDRQLALLAKGKTTPLTERSLFFARIDAAARKNKRNLFDGLTIPSSHRLVMKPAENVFEEARREGFSVVKVKLGDDLARTIPDVALKWRFDFGSAKRKTVESFLSKASSSLRASIDFLEDPFPYDGEVWEEFSKQYDVSLARDRDVQWAELAGVRVIIIKPAVVNPIPLMDIAHKTNRRVVFTSYLDHPLGQMTAAYSAALGARNFPGVVDTCGLLSHEVYEPNAFSECLQRKGPALLPPSGTGFGFDEVLEGLKWREL
ncbi:MAG: hypothetical protein HY465_01725 [Deltaproteobacteria bacterium]|nr:hypothetical protein [Deltaproteobacteria bacterium]